MKKLFILFFFSAITTMASEAQCTMLVLQQTPINANSALICNIYPDTNDATNSEFYGEQWTINQVPDQTSDLMRFDISQIPQGAIIDSAWLDLYADLNNFNGRAGQPMFGDSDACYLRMITSPWINTTVTWANQPTVTNANEILLPQSVSDTESYLNINFKTFVQYWVDSPASNYGFMLQIIASTDYNAMVFCSGYNSDSTRRPTLNICYHIAPTSCLDLQQTPANANSALICNIYPDTNDATNAEFYGEQWTINQVPDQTSDLMRFDISQIPQGAIIDSAWLDLYADLNNFNGRAGQPMFGDSDACYLRMITSPWINTSVTWANQPTVTNANEILLPQSVSDTESYLDINFKTFVQYWVDSPASNYGFMLQIVASTDYNAMVFCSGYNSDSTRRPTLSICYHDSATGINEHGQLPVDAIIFPNPIDGSTFNIKLPDGSESKITAVKIYNMLGREVRAPSIERFSGYLEISMARQLPAGVYIASLFDSSSGRWHNLRFVK